MKYILIWLFLLLELFGAGMKAPVVSVEKDRAVIEIDKIDVGMSGFLVRTLGEGHQSILNKVVVESFDAQTKRAVLQLQEFDLLANNSLPKGKYKASVGDYALLPYAYNRGIVVAPSEEIYYRIVRSVSTMEWIHPDFFATLLSENGHPTPLQSDFVDLSDRLFVGLVFIYLDELLYTLDSQSMKILNVSEAPIPLIKEELKLPFYSRVEKIDAAWWGEGSDELEEYAPHYYELLASHNPENKALYEQIKKSEKLHYLLKKFEIKG